MSLEVNTTESGGALLTLMPEISKERNIFEKALYSYQMALLKNYFPEVKEDIRELAARASHIRVRLYDSVFFSQTAPYAKIETIQNLSAPKFLYLSPVFVMSDNAVIEMSKYARRHVDDPTKRAYDYLQLLSYYLNLYLWLGGGKIGKEWEGKEIVKTLNLPGGRGVCSSVACTLLRVGENVDKIYYKLDIGDTTKFFPGYTDAMVSPCLFLISPNWKYKGDVYANLI